MNKKNGFQTKVWGPAAWIFLHFVAQNYSIEKKQYYRKFFKLVGEILPCKYCRINYKQKLKDSFNDDIFKDRKSLTTWLFYLHNMVNINLEKKLVFPNNKNGRDNAIKFYERFRTSNKINCSKFKLHFTYKRLK